jgi:hypothetical protein
VVFLKPGVIAALLFAVVVVFISTLNTRQPGVSGSQARTLERKSTAPITVGPATTTQAEKPFDPDAYLKEHASPSNAPAEEFDPFKAGAIPVDAQQAPAGAQQTNASRYDALLEPKTKANVNEPWKNDPVAGKPEPKARPSTSAFQDAAAAKPDAAAFLNAPDTSPDAAPKAEVSRQLQDMGVRDSQRAAIIKYPALGVEGSPFHTAFLAEYRRKKETDSKFFNVSDWPVALADEISNKAMRVKLLPPPPASAKQSFTIGSTKDEVLAAQGTPDSLGDSYFMYGSAIVRFQSDKVISWSNSGGKLKAQLAPASQVAAKHSFTIGSTKDEVLATQGTPDSLGDSYFMYGSAIVRFQGDRVVSWSNSGGKLKAQLAPAP